MRYRNALLLALLCTAQSVTFAGNGAELKSTRAGVYLRATLPERLGIESGLAPLDFSLEPGAVVPTEPPVAITTSTNLNSSRTSILLRAFFGDSADPLKSANGSEYETRISGVELAERAGPGITRSLSPYSCSSAGLASDGGSAMFRVRLGGTAIFGARLDEIGLPIDRLSGYHLCALGDPCALTVVIQAF